MTYFNTHWVLTTTDADMTTLMPAKLAYAAVGAIAGFVIAPPSEAVTFDLSWKGQTLGYTAEGSFSYDESAVPTDDIVRTSNLDDFDIIFLHQSRSHQSRSQ